MLAGQGNGLFVGRVQILGCRRPGKEKERVATLDAVRGAVTDFIPARSWVRRLTGADHRSLLPLSALAGGLMLVLADLAARLMPTDQELKLGVFTALIGAPLFGLIAWRAAREWRL